MRFFRPPVRYDFLNPPVPLIPPDTRPWLSIATSIGGALGAVAAVYFLEPNYVSSGMAGTVVLALAGGGCGAQAVVHISNLMPAHKEAQ